MLEPRRTWSVHQQKKPSCYPAPQERSRKGLNWTPPMLVSTLPGVAWLKLGAGNASYGASEGGHTDARARRAEQPRVGAGRAPLRRTNDPGPDVTRDIPERFTLRSRSCANSIGIPHSA
jgi:hypothetical protein